MVIFQKFSFSFSKTGKQTKMETYKVRFEGDEFFSLPDSRKSDNSEVYLDFSVKPLKGMEYEYTVDVVVMMDGKDVVDIKPVKKTVDLKNIIDASRINKFCAEHKMDLPENIHGSTHNEKCVHYFAYHTLLMWALYDLAMTPASQAVFFPLLQENPNHPDKKRQHLSQADYTKHMRSVVENFFTGNGLKEFAYELSPYAMLGVVDEPVALMSAAMARYAASYVDKWAKVFPVGAKMDLSKMGPWYNQVQNFVNSLVAMYISGSFPQSKVDGDEVDEMKAAKGGYGGGYGYGRRGYGGYSYWPYYSNYWPYWYNCGYRRCGYYGTGYGGYGYPYYSGSYYNYPRYGYGNRYRGYGRRGYRSGRFGRHGGGRRHGGGGRRHGGGRRGGGRRGKGEQHEQDEATLLFAGMIQVDDAAHPSHSSHPSHPSHPSHSSHGPHDGILDTTGHSVKLHAPTHHKEEARYSHSKVPGVTHHNAGVVHTEHKDATPQEIRANAFGDNATKYAASFHPFFCGRNCGILPFYQRGSSGSALETFTVPMSYHLYRTSKGMMDKRYVTYSEMMSMMKSMMQGMRHLHNRQEAMEEYLKKQMKMDGEELRTMYHHHRRHGKHSKGADHDEDYDQQAMAEMFAMDYDSDDDSDDEAELAAWTKFEADLTGATAKGVTYRIDDTVRITDQTSAATHPVVHHTAHPVAHPSAVPVPATEVAQLKAQVDALQTKVNVLLQYMNVN